jgi:hypothetical protein
MTTGCFLSLPFYYCGKQGMEVLKLSMRLLGFSQAHPQLHLSVKSTPSFRVLKAASQIKKDCRPCFWEAAV